MLFIVVGLAMTYVPQLPSSQVQTVQAGAATGGATLPMQVIQNASAIAGNAINTVTAGAATTNLQKELVLDGLGWSIAQRIVSGMVRSLINWVNSGFEGSPAFVTDLRGFLTNIADEEIGSFIEGLGDVGSFICSPFRLDVQISIAAQYAQGRAGQSAPSCTLSGIAANIEGFIAGIDPGNGLSDWLQITSAPQTYTPFGAVLNAQVEARARLINAKGETLTEINWGDGFLSQKICESVGGEGNGENCSISKPGRVIADQLNKALGAGQDSLVQADEINELVSALLGQLANQALTGAAGLLGLSGGTGFTYSGFDGSFLDELVNQADNQVVGDGTARNTITEALEREIDYRDTLTTYRPILVAFANSVVNPPNQRSQALAAVTDIDRKLQARNTNIDTLLNLVLDYNDAPVSEQVEILLAYTALSTVSEADLLNETTQLSALATAINIATPTLVRTTNLTNLLASIGSPIVIVPTDSQWISLAADLGIAVE